MNAQNSSRVSATSCGTIQATASRLAGVARLAHFLTLEKRALPFRQGGNLRSAPLGEARSPVRDDSGGGQQRLRALPIFLTGHLKKTAFEEINARDDRGLHTIDKRT